MRINYTLTGWIEVPDGSHSLDGYCIQLPDEDGKSRILKLWETWELNVVGQDESEDSLRDLKWEDLEKLGCVFDGELAKFVEVPSDAG